MMLPYNMQCQVHTDMILHLLRLNFKFNIKDYFLPQWIISRGAPLNSLEELFEDVFLLLETDSVVWAEPRLRRTSALSLCSPRTYCR